jgi:hypothetical protein
MRNQSSPGTDVDIYKPDWNVAGLTDVSYCNSGELSVSSLKVLQGTVALCFSGWEPQ